MTCNYCGVRSGEGEHRCRRCGRKSGDRLPGELALPTEGALAAVAQVAPQALRAPNLARAVQRPLFQARPESNVIPFEAFAPARVPATWVVK